MSARVLVATALSVILAGCAIEEWQAVVWDYNGNVLETRSAFSEAACRKKLAVLRNLHENDYGAECRLIWYGDLADLLSALLTPEQ